ncbi:MAG: bifunctional riboflavin kinase/FAD synthetase [Gammaproteobacteria bacterium]|nr:bifunctional riboflavin kinase/FAD synthetase [Gammaproteobacteria bacterium]
MELIRGYDNLRPSHRGCVVTIGNFDGVHLGHQAVIGQLAEKASELRLPTVIILFEPQPQEFFQPEAAPARLMRLRDKLMVLRRYSVDRVLCLRFGGRLAAMPAEEFIRRVLVDGLGVRYLVVGDDFRFGQRRAGDFDLLQRAGVQYGFAVAPMRTFSIDGGRVSSTRIREALAAGDLAGAARLLGRGFRMSGRVAHGDQRGRTIGVPTANIHLHRKVSPLHGVYVVEMFGLEGEPIPGVANVGTRPTVDGTRTLLEVHLLEFDRDIYGRQVSVEFLHKLRDEQRFESFDELRARIGRDIEEARIWLQERKLG